MAVRPKMHCGFCECYVTFQRPIAASGMELSSQVSEKIMQQQLFKALCVDICSRISSILFRIDRALERKMVGSGGLNGLAFSLAQTPARLPLFCLRAQRFLLLRSAAAGSPGGGLVISGGMTYSTGSKMAEQQQQQQHGGVLDLDRFCCSVCLDLLKDPVTVHCGHVYCRICIEGCWDQEEEKGVFSCPQCRESFSPRPVLGRNNMLAEMMENLKTTGSQQASPSAALVYAGPADVACDFCTGTRRHKAVMSCLTCMVSYCETHLQPHYSVPKLQKHKLVSATARLQEETCSIHDKLMEVYCRTDQQCVCYLCTLDEHKGHNTVSVAAERAEKQKQLGVSQQEVQKRIQERARELKELSQAVKDLKSSAQTAVQACETIFTELICSIERRCSEVKQLITAQEKTAVSQAEELLLQLEEEIARLRRRDTEMEELSHTDHHVGVYLDHEAGTLSFYNVSDTMTLLHKVTFTQSLYPGIYLKGSHAGDSLTNSGGPLLESTPGDPGESETLTSGDGTSGTTRGGSGSNRSKTDLGHLDINISAGDTPVVECGVIL
ncbi:E3 ubiquitin/ISG15 ligase TRIM25-like [Diretmus argenteus]